MLIDRKGNRVSVSWLKNQRIIMFGASTRNKAAVDDLHIHDNILFFVDRDEQKVGQFLDGYAIQSLDSLNNYKDCLILSVVVSSSSEIIEILRSKGIGNCIFYYPEFFDIEEVYQNNERVIQNKRKYHYLHIFSNDKFLVPFYRMLEEQFHILEHLFVLAYRIGNDYANILPFALEKSRKHQNILILDDIHGINTHDVTNKKRLIPTELDCNRFLYSESMKKICDYMDRIILHSAFWGWETKKFVYELTQIYAEKMTWGCFGGDAYFDKDSFEVTQIISKVGTCSLSSKLYEVVKKNYGISGKIDADAYYVYIPEQMIKQVHTHDSVNILLGHSAAEYGNHMEGLETLKKYVNENIKIYCPLSYGSDNYRNEVIRKGKELFGNKFVPLLYYMEQVEYFQFLQTIDVAVFPLKRLAAESTFLLLKAAHVKIYADIGVVKYMQDRLVHFENIEKIKNETLREFVTCVRQQPYSISDLNNYMVSEWKKVLECN